MINCGHPAGMPAVAMSTEPAELLRGGSGCPLTDRVPSSGSNPLYCNVHRVPKVMRWPGGLKDLVACQPGTAPLACAAVA